MKVLVLGSGAREHAIARKFSISNSISGLFVAPGNAGTAKIAENVSNLDIEDGNAVLDFCEKQSIDYVFVGSEQPLDMGVVDVLNRGGVNTFGPNKKSAKLESSKAFSKKFMNKHGIPTADAREFSDEKEFVKYINELSGKAVIKKSGLAAGKGVFESSDKDALIKFGSKVLKDDVLLVEEFLEGYEISIFTLSDGKDFVVLPVCADFKKAGEGDTGLNTGGMGAVCPVTRIPEKTLDLIKKKIVKATYNGLKEDGLNYKGVLYFGIMVTEKGPKLLEYNVRFGDPEAQPLMSLIDSDFVELNEAIVNGNLKNFPLKISSKAALGVVVAAEGYPDGYKKGLVVDDFPRNSANTKFFHASTKLDKDGKIITGGGRCFTVVGIGDSLVEAAQIAYEGVGKIKFEGAWHRKDIGRKFFSE